MNEDITNPPFSVLGRGSPSHLEACTPYYAFPYPLTSTYLLLPPASLDRLELFLLLFTCSLPIGSPLFFLPGGERVYEGLRLLRGGGERLTESLLRLGGGERDIALEYERARRRGGVREREMEVEYDRERERPLR